MTLLGIALSALLCIAAWAATRLIRSHSIAETGPAGGRSSVTVVVPARNEAPRIRVLLASLQEQDHPNFEVIVVDDRSSDGTGDVVRAIAQSDPRIRLERIDARPRGWQGKLHAVGRGMDQARGEWLLLLDADQRLASPTLLRQLVAEFERRDVAVVSLIARNVGERWWERWCLHPVINSPLVWGCILLIQHVWPESPWLIGSLAMRRETYHRLGGARGAAECAAGAYDDLGWARALAQRGGRTAMVYVPNFEDATNFEHFSDFASGIGRWFAGLFSYRKGGWFSAVAIAAALLLILAAAPLALAAALTGAVVDPGLWALTAAPIGVGLIHARWLRLPLWRAFGFHLAALTGVLAIGVAVAVRLRNRVIWRGEPMTIVQLPPEHQAEMAPRSRVRGLEAAVD